MRLELTTEAERTCSSSVGTQRGIAAPEATIAWILMAAMAVDAASGGHDLVPTTKSRSSAANPRAAVLTYFSALAELPDAEADALRTIVGRLTPFSMGSEILPAGAPLDTPLIVASGWVCRAASLPDGRRQILDFYLPGDLVAFSSRPGAVAAASYVCLTRVECAQAVDLLRNVQEEHPRWPVLADISHILEQQTEIRMLQQIVRNGRQTAYERVGHLLLEFHGRLQLCGQARDGTFVLPLTQEVLADAVGLSTVHMNRTIQQLRRDRLIRTEDGQVTILDFPALTAVAGRQGRSSQPRALQSEAWAARG